MLLILALLACRQDDPAPPTTADGLVFDGVMLHLFHAGELRLTLPPQGLVLGVVDALEENKSYDPYWPDDLATGGVRWLPATRISGTLPQLDVAFDGFSATLTVEALDAERFALHLTPTEVAGDDGIVALVRLGLEVDPTEGFYGLGSALDTPNRRGSVRALQLEVDPTTEAFNNEAHVHVPLVLGTSGWAAFVRDDHPMAVDFGTERPSLVTWTAGLGDDAADGLSFELYTAAHPLDLTAHYWRSTGAHRLPARWAYGPWHWRDENEDQAEVEADMATLRDLDIAVSGLWIDRPYASGVNTFDFDPGQFPDAQAMIDLGHDLGFRMALWHTPYVDEVDAADLHATAIAEGYFPPVRPPVFIDWSSPVDYSNPDAYGWWQSLIDRYTVMGIEGYKLDYAEEVLVGAFGGRLPWQFHDGTSELTKHADYQRLYHRVYAETLPADGGFLLCRTAVWGDQVNGPIIWPGDLDATMDPWATPAVDRDGEPYVAVGGLPASLVDALSLGPSGFPFYGADTGGYRHSPPDNETLIRWFQQTALSSVMQVGNSTNDVVWEPTAENGFTPETIDLFRDFSRLHLRLFPYAWTSFETIGRSEGRPLMRPLGLAYPDLGVHPGDTYLFGDHLLVAPVVERGAREREVIFPPGRWVDWFDGSEHTAGVEVVPAELHQLPLFVAEGGIVPMLRPTIDTLAPVADPSAVDSYATTPGVLWIRVVPGPASAFTLYDGAAITQRRTASEGELSFAGGSEFVDGAMVELLAEDEPTSVALDGAALTRRGSVAEVEIDGGWTFEAGSLWARIPPASGVATLAW